MATSNNTTPVTPSTTTRTRRPTQGQQALPAITLALWRWRQDWLLLFLTGIGILASIVILTLAPLLSLVTTTAGLRDLLTTPATNAQLQFATSSQAISRSEINSIQQQFDPLFQHFLHGSLSTQPILATQLAGLTVTQPVPNHPGDQANLYSYDIPQILAHTTLLEGRLPANTSTSALEAILTPATARQLHVQVGSTLTLQLSFTTSINDLNTTQFFSAPLAINIVGLFQPLAHDPFWQGQNYDPLPESPWTLSSLLVSNTGLLNSSEQITAHYHSSTLFTSQGYSQSWIYRLDPRRISAPQLTDLIAALNALQANIAHRNDQIQNANANAATLSAPYLQKISLSGVTFSSLYAQSILDQYRSRMAVQQIPVTILVLQIVALLLFFVALMADLLIDRQLSTIAMLRSRGASGQQVFGSLLTQSIVLSALALCAGLPLALLLAIFVARMILPATSQNALDAITQAPLQAILQAAPYGLLAALIAILALAIALARTLRLDVLASRRETARSTYRPLWLRLNLDLIAALLALLGYVVSLYITSIGNLLNTQTNTLVATPLALIAPLFLLLAIVLLFLRFFSPLLRASARVAARSRGASSMLALAQMSRAPQQATRMTLLLALATAFALFTLIFTASQQQRSLDLAAYESGADFSGDLAVVNTTPSLAAIEAGYQKLAGVQSVSTGYTTTGSAAGSIHVPFVIKAVDSATFAQAANWSAQDSSQPLAALMHQLASYRQQGISQDTVPAIIDASAQNNLNLHLGSIFSLGIDNSYGRIRCMVVAIVQHIPTVDDRLGIAPDSDQPASAGLLLDYETYAAIYAHDLHSSGMPASPLPINHIWLRSSNNTTQLSTLRTALTTSNLRLNNLIDRRAILKAMQNDPLYLNLIGVLALGALTALLLAFVGSLVASWLSVAARLTNFAVLRALGTTPRQVTSVLAWEQIIIYVIALLLGTLFGALLAITVVPALVFTSIPISGTSDLGSNTFYNLQQIIPTQIVVPPTLFVAFLLLVVLCTLALSMMIRIVVRPSLSQTLRLNED